MDAEIQNLHDVWLPNRTAGTTSSHQISFDDLTNSIISTGPFYFYIIDFFDMSLSHISPYLYEMHGFDKESTTFNDILAAIHPEDLEFVIKAEAFLTHFFSEKIGRDKLMSYKTSYCFRGRLHNGEYALINHQALMLTMDDDGGFGKSLNIHTRLDHLTNFSTYKISLIGLDGEPSFMNINLNENGEDIIGFSKREIDIIRLLSNGLNNNEIAERLFISPLTVKKHRKNILDKSDSKNTVELIKNSILQGLI